MSSSSTRFIWFSRAHRIKCSVWAFARASSICGFCCCNRTFIHTGLTHFFCIYNNAIEKYRYIDREDTSNIDIFFFWLKVVVWNCDEGEDDEIKIKSEMALKLLRCIHTWCCAWRFFSLCMICSRSFCCWVFMVSIWVTRLELELLPLDQGFLCWRLCCWGCGCWNGGGSETEQRN